MNTPAFLRPTTRPTRAGNIRHSRIQRAARLNHRDKYPVLVQSVYTIVPGNLIRDGARVTHAQVQELVEVLLAKRLPQGGKVLGFQTVNFGRALQVSVAVPSHRPFVAPDWLTGEEPRPLKTRL